MSRKKTTDGWKTKEELSWLKGRDGLVIEEYEDMNLVHNYVEDLNACAEMEKAKAARAELAAENTPESETPLCDAFDKTCRSHGETVDFARKLERENRRLRALLKEAHSFTRGLSGRKVDKINKRLEEALAGRGE